jgi:hypothetical protein
MGFSEQATLPKPHELMKPCNAILASVLTGREKQQGLDNEQNGTRGNKTRHNRPDEPKTCSCKHLL